MNDIIQQIKCLKVDNIKIELIGSWLWLSGDTFKIKDKLKEIGFFYSNNKKAWFYNGAKYKTHKAFYKNIQELKNRFIYKEIDLNE